jgi:hypothetical protein
VCAGLTRLRHVKQLGRGREREPAHIDASYYPLVPVVYGMETCKGLWSAKAGAAPARMPELVPAEEEDDGRPN